MKHNYRFAGIEILVQLPVGIDYTDEYRLGNFAVEEVENPQIYKVELVKELDNPKGVCIAKYPEFCVYEHEEKRIRYIGSVQNTLEGAYIRVESCDNEHRVQLQEEKFPEKIGAKTILNSLGFEHLIAGAGGFILHCSYIEREGKAILFTAPSETGKSTQAELWKQLRGAKIINGDRAAVCVVDGQILAEGIPFAGSSQYCENRSIPIEAIVYLGQAPETSICRLQGYPAFSKIWEGISVNSWDRKDVEMVSDTVLDIVKRIPIFHLTCTPDESAVIALEDVLKRENNLCKKENKLNHI